MSEVPQFKVGEIVENLTGRNIGNLAVVISKSSERFVLVADGDKRKFDNPKKKNTRHIRSTGFISKDVIDSLDETGRISNAKLRYVIQDFISNHLIKDDKKGE